MVALPTHPGRFRRQPRRRFPALYDGDVRFCRRRRADGTSRGPFRHRRAACASERWRSQPAISRPDGHLACGRLRSRTLLIGLGCSASFGPLMADISHWFVRRRGIAVALAASGNYIAGTIWPPVVQHFIATSGWRATHIGIGMFCSVDDVAAGVLACAGDIDDHRTDEPRSGRGAGRPRCRFRR